MIKQIVHISDLHVRTFLLHEHYHKQLNEFLIDLRPKLKGFTYDEIRIVLTGDVVHQKINISNEQVVLVTWFFNELSKIGKLIIIPGNHDFLENNMNRLDTITPIVETLNNPNITYFRDGGMYSDDNINWVVYSLFQHNNRPEFEVEDDKLHIGLFHGPIQGLSTDTGYEFDDTAYDKLNFVGLDLLLCGDIHKRQTFTLPNGGKGIMIGSLIQQNFGETVNHHGYGLYDVDSDEYMFHDVLNESPYLHFKINDIKDIENGEEIFLNLG